MAAYYNEFSPHKAAWLRHLIEEGVIADGFVDERPIQQVQPDDVRGFTQCHWFAGIGVWSYALRLAGWDDDRPVWTGSCPCGPFSKAGLRQGFADPRHLWPEWFRLIGECGPNVLFGEQSDAADAWIDLVSADLESRGYAFGSPDLPAAGFGGAHIRQRFDWVADANNAERWTERAPWHDGEWPKTGRVESAGDAEGCGDAGGVDAAIGFELRGGRCGSDAEKTGRVPSSQEQRQWIRHDIGSDGSPFGVGDPTVRGSQGGAWEGGAGGRFFQRLAAGPGGADWLFGRDHFWRPVEPGTCPLVDASPARVGLLRGYGDALDAEATANFIEAYMDAVRELA